MACRDSYDSLDIYTDVESRFQSLISQSTQIHEGPPKTFLLNTVKETLGDCGEIRRWTFGERNQSKTRTIMMMGEKGTGKSTLINVMVNYILGVEYKDNVRFEIIKEEEKSQTESQTTAITMYEIYGNERVRVPFSLRLIDTPGYTDTAGVKKDEQIAKNIIKLFEAERGVHQIDAVCLVVKASQNRLTDTQLYIFDAILSLFGKDIENNIMALITFSERGKPGALAAKAGVPCARNEKKELIYFKFNNTPEEVNYDRADCVDDDDEEDDEYWKKNWAIRVKTMENFFVRLDNMETRSLQMTQEVRMERDQLEISMQSLQDQITAAENLQTMLKQTQDALETHKEDIAANKDFEHVVDEPCKRKVDTGYPATCCKVCETNCHYPCTIVSASRLNWCAVMKGKKCTVCEKKCSYKDHIKEKKMYKSSTRRVTKTYEKLKDNYERAAGEKATKETLEKTLQEQLKNVLSDKKALVDESYERIISLSKIALRPDSRSTLQHLDFLLERLKEIGTAEQIQKIEDRKRRAAEVNKLK
ncbi:hypothetical protein SKAU_G00300910 [Synaphobranchus kaupii]|uniref:AIG1-type G domain-containing protein n=1 Tax=Synaphobranchus kaupii TaxID=118154 RepID=A0A9Q1IN90_SYNKA|nr:hypothetical protein SKAU_G00300910 [Synaphobranchus kaupii]